MPVNFSIIGGAGFRAQYYLRIARALPELFRVGGLVVRDRAQGQAMEAAWGVQTYHTLDELLQHEEPDFAVVSVSGGAVLEYLYRLAEIGLPALAETPPAASVADLELLHKELTVHGAWVQVAEQYPYHPVQEARLSLIRSGRLGRITEATVSVSHLYHGAALMRRMLGLGFEEAGIRAMKFTSSWVGGPTRSGPPTEDRLIPLERELAWLDFGDRLGIYDFTKDQHRSWTRSNHLSVRGERGEIFDNRVLIQQENRVPLELELKRMNKGEQENAEGYYLQGILCGEQWLYNNPFAPARLYDDEIAIASCLDQMALYAAGGPGFYGLPEASQDVYLGKMIQQAIETGGTVRAERMCWAEGK